MVPKAKCTTYNSKMSQTHFLFSTFLLLFLFFTIINHSSSARFLGGGHDHHTPSSRRHHHHKITFLIKDILNATTQQPQQKSPSSKIPFSKPLGFFPPNRGIPIAEPSNPTSSGGLSTQTLDVSNIGLYFPPRAALQELESGAIIVIDETMFDVTSTGESAGTGTAGGKAQGVYVANFEDETSHMMAMTAYFSGVGGFKDGLRFFGVHRKDVNESHVAVIGGIGKYVGANGYATIKGLKAVNFGHGAYGGQNRLLSFDVYLS